MSEIGLLTGMRVKQVRNFLGRKGFFSELRRHSRLKVAVITLFAIFFWLGMFLMFRNGFNFIGNTLAEVKPMVLGILFALFFAALTLMLAFSNGVVSYSSLFRSSETEFLFGSPLKPESIYMYKLIEGLVFSSWALLFLALPLIVAYGLYGSLTPVPWHFYPAALAFFAVFVLIPAGLGSAMALLIGTYFSHRPKRLVVGILVILGLIGLVWLVKSYPAFLLAGKGYQAYMRDVLGRFSWTENPLLPSYWISNGMLSAGRGEVKDALFYFLLILSNSLFVLAVGYHLAARIYLKGYQSFRGTVRRRRIAPHGWADRVIRALLFWLPGHLQALVLKDIKSFRRDATQWSQALIFFGLIAVYVMNLRLLKYDVQRIGFKNMVAFLNLTATSLTLATFTSRFIFPLLSLEGKRFWVLGLAPIRRSDLLMGKFAFSFCGCFVISSVLMLTSDLMLNIPQVVTFLHLFAVLVISAGLSGLAVGLGAVHADLREDNPARIVSGFGGTLNLVLSMLFVGVVVTALAVPCHYYLVRGLMSREAFRLWISASLILVGALGTACCAVPLILGRRALDRMET